MKVLIASYPRAGSTALEAALAFLIDGTPRTLHEPFRKYSGADAREFNRELDVVVATTDILKHHPGNVLSDRQNRILYRSWLSAGGSIVHLYRRDLLSQARSLVIARALNSFHRRHRVTIVPADRIASEHLDLSEEFQHQAALLAEVPHVAVAYEDLFAGDLDERMSAFRSLTTALDTSAPQRLNDRTVAARVESVLAPRRRTNASNEGEAVRLIDQVPRFAGSTPFLTPADCAELGVAIRTAAGRGCDGPNHGVWSAPLDAVLARPRIMSLIDGVRAAIVRDGSVRVVSDQPSVTLHALHYDGARYPDHDLTLWHRPVDTRVPAAHVSIALTNPSVYDGGDVHLAGRGRQPQSRERGWLCYFANGIGARRTPVVRGEMSVIVGAFPFASGQVLAAGQLLGTGSMFVD